MPLAPPGHGAGTLDPAVRLRQGGCGIPFAAWPERGPPALAPLFPARSRTAYAWPQLPVRPRTDQRAGADPARHGPRDGGPPLLGVPRPHSRVVPRLAEGVPDYPRAGPRVSGNRYRRVGGRPPPTPCHPPPRRPPPPPSRS